MKKYQPDIKCNGERLYSRKNEKRSGFINKHISL